ncbi:chromosome partitioning protein ParB, partial [Leptospira alexanderi]|uniref:chromosome partitioning protein ParB n=1 Tax=Leptospira alexanderi TaxID=100053 RepID=UPI001FD325E6
KARTSYLGTATHELREKEETIKKELGRLLNILDALTAKKDGTLVTGENRYRIALELKDHEDESVRRRVENIPVRYYMNELTQDEEYDILEGDNLFRRHLTAEQRKERLKRRILRKYKDELVQDNRGGDRKSESSQIQSEEETNGEQSSRVEKQREGISESELGLFGEVGTISEQAKESNLHGEGLKEGSNEKSNYQGDSLIEKPVELAKKVSENENIPLGTARRYVTELKKELKTKEPNQTAKKEKPAKKEEGKKKTRKQIAQAKAKEFQKKYLKMTYDQKEAALDRLLGLLVRLRKQQSKLNEQVMENHWKDSEIVYQLTAVGQDKRIWKLKV